MTGGRIPIIPTIVVIAAVLTMIGLGMWQLQRLEEKEAMLARYGQALTMSSEVRWPVAPGDYEQAHYRRTSLTCDRVLEMRATAGRSERDVAGWWQVARCEAAGGEVEVAMGWANRPEPMAWTGGPVQGLIVPAGDEALRVIAMPPLAGLQPMQQPDPANLPNNHLAYAGQWFFFAFTAALIYVLALRRRGR